MSNLDQITSISPVLAFCLDGGYFIKDMTKKKLFSHFTPFRKDGRFYNHSDEQAGSFLSNVYHLVSDSLVNRMRFLSHDDTHWHIEAKPPKRSKELLITWIGHSTFLIQVAGCNILTDPIFGTPSFFFPRLAKPGVMFDQLPPIDLVMVSHNHIDHMHLPSLKLLEKHHKPVFLVPHGDKKWFDYHGFAQCTENMWGDQVSVNGVN